jgi:hypothetical protein
VAPSPVLVQRMTRRLGPGQVILFGDAPPGRSLLIKRIAAVPGDAVPSAFTTVVPAGADRSATGGGR